MKSLAAIALLLPCLAVPHAAFAQIHHRVEHVANPHLVELPAADSGMRAGERVLQLQLDGKPRRLLLVPDRTFELAAARHVPPLARGRLRLYRGTIMGNPDHWVRLHLRNGRWEGVIASDTHTWVLTGAHRQPDAARAAGIADDAHIVYRQDALHGDIDLRHDNHPLPSPTWRSHTADAAKGGALPYTLGVSLVLDTEFQELAPDPAASAVAILHLVAGYYERTAATAVYLKDLKLLPPGNAGIVGNGDLLDEIATYVASPGAPAFHAATHLLTGKPDAGGGAAWGTSLCNRESAIGYASWY